MKNIIVLLTLGLILNSCTDYNTCTQSMAGLYDAQIIGISGPFTLAVSVDNSDNIFIDANWYDDIWDVVEADTDGCADYNSDNFGEVNIHIDSQNLSDNIRISGNGFYYEYTLQLDYKIIENDQIHHYTLIASKR